MKTFSIKLSYALVCVCLVLALAGSSTPVYAASIIFVDADSACISSCGSSWASAYPDLQSALAVASSGDEIWVAEGVYYPDVGAGQTNNDVLAIFTLINGVSIYGGFAGTESLLSQRDSTSHPTILSGDIDQNDTNTDGNFIAETTANIQGINALHVLQGSNTDSTALLDGFIVTAGYANSGVNWVNSGNGGGLININGSPTITDVTFRGNYASSGGGIYSQSGNMNMTKVAVNNNSAENGGGVFVASGTLNITDSHIDGNSVSGSGGGFFNQGTVDLLRTDVRNNTAYGWIGGGALNYGNLTVTDSTFDSNVNSANNGGAIFNWNPGNLTITGSTFSNNNTAWAGGAIISYSNVPVNITNSTFYKNDAGAGGYALYLQYAGPSSIFNLTNVTFAENGSGAGAALAGENGTTTNLRNALIANNGTPNCGGVGFTDLGGNLQFPDSSCGSTIPTADPLLGSLNDNGGSTETMALLIGSSAVDAGTNEACPATDQRGLARPQGPTCDIGAFEFINPVPGISSLSPTSAQAGAADLSINVYGTDLANGAVVKWFDGVTNTTTDLATTFVSSSELAAVVPSALLVNGGTYEVSVFNPSPGGGFSSPLIFFVTDSGATVTSTDSATSADSAGTATASTGGTGPGTLDSVTANAIGKGTITVAKYSKNPISLVPKGKKFLYFDVRKSKKSSFKEVKTVVCKSSKSTVQWFDGISWKIAKSQTRSGGCNTVELNDTSSPTIAQLSGTVFALVNLPPVAETGGPYLSAVNTDIQFDGSGSSDPEYDTLSYAWDFDDSATGTGETPTHSYSTPGIYNVCLTVTDEWQDSDPSCTLAVVYDPSGGFVTGGGWIDSPVNEDYQYMQVGGKADFGFVAKYKKGTTVPDGNTQFQFKAGDLNFHSSSYEWLVVAGSAAQFKGESTLNGEGSYSFRIWADDGASDTFRIQIWDDNGIVYDNGSQQSLGGGSIKVHQ